MRLCTITALLVVLCNIYLANSETTNSAFKRARIESCPGCSLNRLTEVKKFIYEDVPKYENVEFKKIQGALPELVLLDENDEEVDRLPLKELNRQQCNDLLEQKGFKLKDNSKADL